MDNIYKNIEECNPDKKRKILIVFDNMITDKLSNKTLNSNRIICQRQKAKDFCCFYCSVLFCCAKHMRLNSTHYFIMKVLNKQELQQIAFNHSSDIIDFKDLINIYNICITKPHSFLVTDATLAPVNPLGFRNNLLERILKLIMGIDDKIKHEKLQYGINRQAEKI